MTDPTGPTSGDSRVLRGGCFWFSPEESRSAIRYKRSPDFRCGFFGFRLLAFQDGK